MPQRILCRAQLRAVFDTTPERREAIATELAGRLIDVPGVRDVTTGVERNGALTAEWTQDADAKFPEVWNGVGVEGSLEVVHVVSDPVVGEGRRVA